MRKVYVNVVLRVVLTTEDEVAVSEVLNEMGMDVYSNTDGAEVLDTEVLDYEVVDSK